MNRDCPDPSVIGPGYVVRVRCERGGLTYWTASLTKSEADQLADQLSKAWVTAGPFFMPFQSSQGQVLIRADRVVSIEVTRTSIYPTPRTPQRVEMETR